MRRISVGLMLAAALAVTGPTLLAVAPAQAKTAAAASDESASSEKSLSKEDQAKLREHNKLRAEIMKVKYPASKQDVVAHVKGIKPDDKKWFEETLPDKTFSSPDEVMSALGWESAPPAEKTAAKPSKAKSEKTPR